MPSAVAEAEIEAGSEAGSESDDAVGEGVEEEAVERWGRWVVEPPLGTPAVAVLLQGTVACLYVRRGRAPTRQVPPLLPCCIPAAYQLFCNLNHCSHCCCDYDDYGYD